MLALVSEMLVAVSLLMIAFTVRDILHRLSAVERRLNDQPRPRPGSGPSQ